MEPPEPITLRYIDVTLPGGSKIPLTLFPADTVAVVGQPDRLVVEFAATENQAAETCTVFLGPGVAVWESSRLRHPVPLDENGEPRQFQTMDEYRAWAATRGNP